ncbi:MAG: hypothetical protein HY544_02165 [Candidatus Diapherotrites archaeon]|uniref:Uncharacterized protein n=1 Tax=Candidatus Iainarchaeum sp. TaxID=3101447 RepID=A0A8T3YKS0_9ARCH|nr:hypothetical protein [Candidatus Diapherotrites archaeon]
MAAKLILGLFLAAMVALGGCLGQAEKKAGQCTLEGCTMDVNDENSVQGANNAIAAKGQERNIVAEKSHDELLQEKVAPSKGVVLPVKWGDVLVKAVEAGAIDLNTYNALLARNRTKFTPEHEKLLLEGSDENISFTPENAYFNLTMLWALGLVNDNPILTKGKISEYGEQKAYFASTGGWGLGRRTGGELLASAKIIIFTPEQQKIVEEVAANTYRPCCSNPTGFPDCNHGMAALALAELMASQGATMEQIYEALLVANSYWFTQNYVSIAQYLEENGKDFSSIDSKELLGYDYSSQNGFGRIGNSLKNIPKVNVKGSTCAN